MDFQGHKTRKPKKIGFEHIFSSSFRNKKKIGFNFSDKRSIEIFVIKNQLGKNSPQNKLKFPTIELLKSGKISVRLNGNKEIKLRANKK